MCGASTRRQRVFCTSSTNVSGRRPPLCPRKSPSLQLLPIRPMPGLRVGVTPQHCPPHPHCGRSSHPRSCPLPPSAALGGRACVAVQWTWARLRTSRHGQWRKQRCARSCAHWASSAGLRTPSANAPIPILSGQKTSKFGPL